MYPGGIPPEREETIFSLFTAYKADYLDKEKQILEIEFNTQSPLAAAKQRWRRFQSMEDEPETLTLFGRIPIRFADGGIRKSAPQSASLAYSS